MLEYIPEHLDFEVEFEPTKVEDKKYVINGDTGEYIGVVTSSAKLWTRQLKHCLTMTWKMHTLAGVAHTRMAGL